ncbi:MAG: cytidylyltransferase family protein [Desulfurococcales archaeon]|nr:cytidylyltransferase family protein [Desulfurococcales archaeon]
MNNKICSRARKYADNLIATVDNLKKSNPGLVEKYPKLFDAIDRYLKDTYYFIETNDCDTALVSVSYAEGLLDSLKYMGYAEFEWTNIRREEKTVFVGGTFDIMHPGHVRLLKYASSLGKLYVVIARDKNVRETKGKKPVLSEKSRLELVSSIKYVYQARLGDLQDKMKPLMEIKPDIVVLGPDQPYDPKELASYLEKLLGKKVEVLRYDEKEEFEPGLRSSSDVIKRICRGSYCLSIGCSTPPCQEDQK